MAKKYDIARIQKGALNADEAEALFSTVDETGHTDEERAARERQHARHDPRAEARRGDERRPQQAQKQQPLHLAVSHQLHPSTL